MLTSLEVQNYKSIKKLTLGLRPFMVLVGPNGAGKTNVVRAMELLGNLLDRGTTEPARELGWTQVVHREQRPARSGLRLGASFALAPRPGAKDRTPINAAIAIVLQGKVGDHDIRVMEERLELTRGEASLTIERKGTRWVRELGSDPELWAPLMSPTIGAHALPTKDRLEARLAVRLDPEGADPTDLTVLHRGLGSVFHAMLRECSMTRLRLDASALRSDARYEVHSGHTLGPSGEGLPVAVDRLRGRGPEPALAFVPILVRLREVYPRIEDVVPEAFGQGRVTLGFRERGIAEPIPLDGVSDGVLHALALLIALSSPGCWLLAIEEPENALHPWSVRKILEYAQDGEQQVLFTTHSETVVNAVRDPDALFIVEADDASGTRVEAATSKEKALASILAESGQKLGDVWLDGSLGGVPQP